MDNKSRLGDELMAAIQKLDKGLALKFPEGHDTIGFLLGTLQKVCDEKLLQIIINDINREITLYSGGEDAHLDSL